MAPRWWDWGSLAVTLIAGGYWVVSGMPGLPADLNPLLAPATAQAPPRPATPAAVPHPPEQLPTVVRAAPAAPPEPARLAAAPAPEPTQADAPVAPPRMPEVIRPSIGDSRDTQQQTSTTVSNLPVVIRPSDRSQPMGSSGTGFFIARDGSIITAAHVVRGCKKIFVISRYLKEMPATLLGIDFRNDVAVLQATNTHPPQVLVMAARPSRAEPLEIFGYPGDGDRLAPTGTQGRLRPERPKFDGVDRRDFLWVDANAVRAGFSGGPILNQEGDAIGLINGHVVQRVMMQGAVVRDTKYVFGASTQMINAFLTQEVPALVPASGLGIPPEEADKAVVHILCLH